MQIWPRGVWPVWKEHSEWNEVQATLDEPWFFYLRQGAICSFKEILDFLCYLLVKKVFTNVFEIHEQFSYLYFSFHQVFVIVIELLKHVFGS